MVKVLLLSLRVWMKSTISPRNIETNMTRRNLSTIFDWQVHSIHVYYAHLLFQGNVLLFKPVYAVIVLNEMLHLLYLDMSIIINYEKVCLWVLLSLCSCWSVKRNLKLACYIILLLDNYGKWIIVKMQLNAQEYLRN